MRPIRFFVPLLAVAAAGCTSTLATGGAPHVGTPQASPAASHAPAPAMLNPKVTQATLRSTICVSGFTATIRPPSTTTTRIKRAQIAAYGLADTNLAHYEEDHVVSLELGGAAAAPVNLFPEAHPVSLVDDHLENSLHAQVCAGTMSLAAAQAAILATKVAHGYRADVSASVS